MCRSGTLPCVSPLNYSLICLASDRVGDEFINCLGAADERQHCRRAFLSESSWDEGFRCRNDDKCIQADHLCDKYRDCPLGDDEIYCENRSVDCSVRTDSEFTDVDEVLCNVATTSIVSFSLVSSSVYPRIENQQIIHTSIEQRFSTSSIDSVWQWRCNHGIYVRIWPGNDISHYQCFCPPNYYGNLCEYQNQRVSLTIRVRVFNKRNIYTILLTLIDDDYRKEINSYQNFIWMGTYNCEQMLNAYLTYATRPKNARKDDSVHVHIFNQTNLAYLASWKFPIRFHFLPVHRMAIILDIPDYQSMKYSNCPIACLNGTRGGGASRI